MARCLYGPFGPDMKMLRSGDNLNEALHRPSSLLARGRYAATMRHGQTYSRQKITPTSDERRGQYSYFGMIPYRSTAGICSPCVRSKVVFGFGLPNPTKVQRWISPNFRDLGQVKDAAHVLAFSAEKEFGYV